MDSILTHDYHDAILSQSISFFLFISHAEHNHCVVLPLRTNCLDSLAEHNRCLAGSLAACTQDHIRNVFYRMGFDDEGIVALSGAHTIGRAKKVQLHYTRKVKFALRPIGFRGPEVVQYLSPILAGVKRCTPETTAFQSTLKVTAVSRFSREE